MLLSLHHSKITSFTVSTAVSLLPTFLYFFIVCFAYQTKQKLVFSQLLFPFISPNITIFIQQILPKPRKQQQHFISLTPYRTAICDKDDKMPDNHDANEQMNILQFFKNIPYRFQSRTCGMQVLRSGYHLLHTQSMSSEGQLASYNHMKTTSNTMANAIRNELNKCFTHSKCTYQSTKTDN